MMDLRTTYFQFLKRKRLYKDRHPLHRWEMTRKGGYVALLSFPKSGRSWLRFMLCEAQRLETGLPIERFIFDVPDKRRGLPKFYYVHGVSPHEDFETYNYDKIAYGGPGGIIFLVRDPIKVIASFYSHMQSRKFHRMTIDPEQPFSEFVANECLGLPKYIDYLEYYWDVLNKSPIPHLVVKYEDLRNDTEKELSRILNFSGVTLTPSEVEEVIEKGASDNMREVQENRTYGAGWLLPVRHNGEMVYKTGGAFLTDRFEAYEAPAKDYALKRMGESDLLKQLGYID